MEIIEERSNFSQAEIAQGKILEARITRIYEQNDEVIYQSNCFTKSIVAIMGVTSAIFTLFSTLFSLICNSRFPPSIRYQWDGEIGIGPISRLPAMRTN